MATKKGNDYSEGFTIIELLVAIIVIIVTLVPFVLFTEGAFTTTDRNADRIEAANIVSSVLESATAIPYKSLGYYEDEFSTADSNYPTSGANKALFNQIFGTQYLNGTNYPYVMPVSTTYNYSGAQTVDLGTTSPSCVGVTNCTSASQDLIQPFQIYPAGRFSVAVFEVVVWQSSVTLPNAIGPGDCA